ncbi:hypothetical protein Esti_001730 [Eimeria stiedai]
MAAATNLIRGTCTFDQRPFGAIACCPAVPPGAAALPEEPCGVLFHRQDDVETEPVSPIEMDSLAGQEAPEGLLPCNTTTETTSSEETATGGRSTCSRSAFLSDGREEDSPPVQLAFIAVGAPQAAAGEWAAAAGCSPADSEAEALPAQLRLLSLNCVETPGAPSTGTESSRLLQGGPIPPHRHQPQPVGRVQSEGGPGKPYWAPRENGHVRLLHSASPPGHLRLHAGHRSRRRSCPSSGVSTQQGIKQRASDTSDQVYRLGLLLRQLGRLGKVRSCWQIWQAMKKTEGKHRCAMCVSLGLRSGLKPNAVSYGCILDALVSNGALDLALKLLAEMKASDQAIRPNTVMYSTLIKGCAQSKQLDQALALFEEMSAQGIEVNTVTYNSLLDVCARVGAMDRAAMLLDDMLKNGVKPDLITFSTIIKGYCAHGQMDKGLLLLKAMKQKNISPDGVLYNSLLDGCVRAGRSSLCLELWREMQAQRIKPSNFTLSILIKLHGRMRQLQVAFELVKQLPKMYDFQLNAHVYTCLMAACIENRQYRAAYNVLQNMQREGVAADGKTISTIVFGCLKGRMHAQAVEIVLNALESLRHLDSQGPSGQGQRGRQAAAGSPSGRQTLPVIDEKTVRLLAHHLRDQHMHQECNLVLDTAVSVGVMSRAAAHALLAGDGHGDRKPLAAIARASSSGLHVQPHARGPRASSPARLSASRGEQLQGGLCWAEAAAAREGSEGPCRGAPRSLRKEEECQEQAGDVAQAERDFLTFSSNALSCQQGESAGACEGPWSQQDKQRHSEESADADATPPSFRLQPMADATARLGVGMVLNQPSIVHSDGLLVPPAPVPKAADAAPRGLEGASTLASPVLFYGRGAGAARLSQGLPHTEPLEDWIAPPHLPKWQHPGFAWNLPTATSPTCAPGRSSLAGALPPLDPRPPPHVITTPANEPAGRLEAGSGFIHEDTCRLPGLPASWPLYPFDNLVQASCTRASLLQ